MTPEGLPKKELRQRVLSSIIPILAVVTLSIGVPYPFFHPIFVLVLTLVLSTSLWEMYQITKNRQHSPHIKTGIISCIAFTVTHYLSITGRTEFNVHELILFAFIIINFAIECLSTRPSLVNLSISIFGFGYVVIPLNLLLNIAYSLQWENATYGAWWTFYVLFVTKISDTGGYFFGKRLGQNKLAPQISPKKTIEGAAGGIIASALGSIVLVLTCQYVFLSQAFPISIWAALFLGCITSIIGQFGDLAESLLKRDSGVKDSNKIPGLGGLLDMTDSLIFSVPTIYLYLAWQGLI